jgi:hypothetical protein
MSVCGPFSSQSYLMQYRHCRWFWEPVVFQESPRYDASSFKHRSPIKQSRRTWKLVDDERMGLGGCRRDVRGSGRSCLFWDTGPGNSNQAEIGFLGLNITQTLSHTLSGSERKLYAFYSLMGNNREALLDCISVCILADIQIRYMTLQHLCMYLQVSLPFSVQYTMRLRLVGQVRCTTSRRALYYA